MALPSSRFVPWLLDHRLDVPRLVGDRSANRISSFFGLNMVVAVVVLLNLTATDPVLTTRRRLPVTAGSLRGASVGLPLFLLLQERTRNDSFGRDDRAVLLDHR